MKLKKRYIIILLLVIFISIIGFILKNKNIEISNIFNKKYKEGDKITLTSAAHCDSYYADYKTATDLFFNKNDKGTYFQIIKADNNTTGWDLYLVDGCAWGVDAFLIEYNKVYNNNAKEVCETMANESVTYYNMSINYNDSLCVKDKENVEYRETTKNYSSFGYSPVKYNATCSIEWDQNNEDGFEGAYFKVDGASQPLDYYIDECGCSSNLKNFIAMSQKSIYESKCGAIQETNKCIHSNITDDAGYTRATYYFNGLVQGENCSTWVNDDTEKDGSDIIGEFYYYKNNPNNAKCYYNYSQEATGKVCNYVYDSSNKWNSFLVNGCTWDMASYMDKCSSVGEGMCVNSAFKSFLIEGMQKENSLSIHVETYNNKCEDKINYGTVIVYQNDDAYGLSCEANGWQWNETGSCKRSATSGTINGPDVSNLAKYGTRKFIGWSTSKSCNHIDRTTNTFDINFTGTKTYYACYEETSTTSALFQSNNKKDIDIKYVNEQKQCDNDNIKVTNTYYKKTTNINPYKEKLTSNSYCNVVCEDNVSVSYPSIFETVPAGQYFELMYEPEITGTRTCTSEFNYNKWKDDYDDAVEAEIEAMDALNLAQANYDAATALSKTSSGKCGCCCSGPTCGCSGSCKTYYSDSESETYYTSDSSSLKTSPDQKASGCGSSAFSTSRNATVTNASTALTTAKNNYNAAVQKRIKLEQNNLQCYTILDQDNNTEKSYSDIFKGNYNEIINLNNTKYNIKTPKVNVSSTNSSTSSTYANYITNKTPITNTILQQTENSPIGKTVDFYAVYPDLVFKYDDGSNGAPVSLTTISEEQSLKAEAHVKIDTGSFTNKSDTGVYTKDSTRTGDSGVSSLEEKFYVNGSYGSHINFKAYTATSISRQVQYYFTYHESKEYFSKKQSGETSLSPLIPSDYISLSRKEHVTTKTNTKILSTNHVYPVSLKAVTDNYAVSLTLKNQVNQTYNSNSDNYLSTTNFGTSLTGKYTCDYKVTNDALTLSEKTGDYKKLKSNTIFRSVATDDIDPNNRLDTGKLGDNWSSEKGQAVQDLMIKIETNNGTATNDTYNPDNLEYSFTLTPTLIQKIQEYNNTTNYDDFKLTCTTVDGRECISEFLTNLADGKVGTYTYPNYSSLNSFDSYKLNQVRKDWKYYIKSFSGTSTDLSSNCESLGYNLYKCKKGKMTLDNYTTLYEMWGVLP